MTSNVPTIDVVDIPYLSENLHNYNLNLRYIIGISIDIRVPSIIKEIIGNNHNYVEDIKKGSIGMYHVKVLVED